MLELGHDQRVIADLWEAAESKVHVPESMGPGFFQPHGPMPVYYENKRTFHRFFMRGKAVLHRQGVAIGTYTKDVSRQGVGFYSPVQLLPMERIQLRVPSAELTLEVARCRRVDKGCFDCGGRFAL